MWSGGSASSPDRGASGLGWRVLSLFRGAALYLLLVLLPQSLWLYSSIGRDVGSSANSFSVCEGCSFLPFGHSLVSRSEAYRFKRNAVANVTLMYEQVCDAMCGISEDSGEFCREEERIMGGCKERESVRKFHLMDELDFGRDGGWTVAHNLPDLAEPCNIKRKNASLSQLEFLEEFAYSEPVILYELSDQESIRAASSKWRLLADYGHHLITVATANTHSYHKVQMTLCEYVEKFMRPQSLETLGNETLYYFGDNDWEQWAELFSLYHLPSYSVPGLEPVLSFGLAGPGTGVPFHIHGPAFAETLFGRKRWFLYPPEESPQFHPNESTLQWVSRTLPSLPAHLAPLQCTLSPGEVYVL